MLKGTVGIRNTWGWPFPQQRVFPSQEKAIVLLCTEQYLSRFVTELVFQHSS